MLLFTLLRISPFLIPLYTILITLVVAIAIFGSYRFYNSDKMKEKREESIREKLEISRKKELDKRRKEKLREINDKRERRRESRQMEALEDDLKEIVEYTKRC